DTVSFIRVLAACQPLMALDFTLGGALRGAGDTRFPLLAVFLGFYVCRLGVAWLVTFVLGLAFVWLRRAPVADYAPGPALKAPRASGGPQQCVDQHERARRVHERVLEAGDRAVAVPLAHHRRSRGPAFGPEIGPHGPPLEVLPERIRRLAGVQLLHAAEPVRT